ncbi:MFS transporter [Herbaspirillum sp. BH-1]|uniref:MFS family arabinose efflux permease n=1 Tax=Herbaspirillum frisingense TaxID=92645 RepID=A0ABU1PED1_9BURK|nr:MULTISPECIES: MFS transporter [Herbaspirillum]MDR6584209.1 putative MFS family arabinose efflux permease [Herbaspirillum frisingense]PLY59436.1 MFS transporter [Herbaspirillum sp. BH-1]
MNAKAGSIAWLSRLNFFLADVRDGLGPFLGVFLMGQGWAADDIGYVMTLGGIAGMLATTPAGALTDAVRAKRLVVGLGSVLVVAGSLLLLVAPSFTLTAISQVGTGIVGAVIGPAIAGLTLGIVGQQGLPAQLGRNEAWNHAGNVFSAALAGALGYYWGLPAVFVLMAVMALASLVCLSRIRPQDIDHDVARGLDPERAAADPQVSTWRVLVASRPLMLLALAMMLFHLGNAAMLPLLSQSVVARGGADPALYTALTVIVAQLVMIPTALLTGRFAERQGYWLPITIALLALPVRGLVAGVWDSPWALLPVQMLDGVGAGLLGVALPGSVARILQGSGHINIGLGAVTTIQSVGAALSPALAGVVAKHYGYGAAFAALTGIAVLALLVWGWLAERRDHAPGGRPAVMTE